MLSDLATLPSRASWLVVVVKNLPSNGAGDTGDMDSISELGSSPGGGMETQSSILAWRIPWKEKSGRLQYMGLQRVGHD